MHTTTKLLTPWTLLEVATEQHALVHVEHHCGLGNFYVILPKKFSNKWNFTSPPVVLRNKFAGVVCFGRELSLANEARGARSQPSPPDNRVVLNDVSCRTNGEMSLSLEIASKK